MVRLIPYLASRAVSPAAARFMNLRVHTDYSLRVLLYLAHKNEQASVDEIATAYAISKDHLFKVVQHLVRSGYVTSKSTYVGRAEHGD